MATAPVYISNNNAQGFQFLSILSITCYFSIMFNSHPNACKVVSTCHIDLHFPMSTDVEDIFMYLFGYL